MTNLPLPLLSLVIAVALHSATTTASAAQPPPNVVFILADDLGWGELGCFGQKKIPTPHLDRLAAQGTRLTQHYSGAPVCAPSRCVLMTGKHLGHAEIRGNKKATSTSKEFTEGQHPLSAAAITLAQLFQQAGYKTAAMGKWGLGPVGSTGDPNKKGFDLFFGYNCQSVAHSFYPAHLWRNSEKIPLNAKPISGHQTPLEGDVRMETYIGQNYASDSILAEAERFIAQNAQHPFFLYLPFTEPHVAMHPPAASVDRFPKEWDPEPYRGESGYLPHPRPHAAYAAMISDLDSHVGRIMDALEKNHAASHTLVLFSSDNGTTHPGKPGTRFHIGGVDPFFFNSTAGLRGFKGSVYEGGIRVPTIAWMPGRIPAGRSDDTPSFFADWLPTLCDAASLPPPAHLDGVSLWQRLTGGPAPTRATPMLWIFPEYGGQIAVRIRDFKLLRQRLATKNPGPWEIYDLASDRSEKNDIASKHPELISQAEALLRREVSPNPTFPIAIPGVTP